MKGHVFTQAKRRAKALKRRRKGLCLEDQAIADKTRERYTKAVFELLPILEASSFELEDTLCEWIENCFAQGGCITYISDALSGLQHFAPWVKGQISKAWRLFKIWRKVERPKQAPPLPCTFALALVSRAVEIEDLELAAMLCLGFWGLLRTGELLLVQKRHVLIKGQEMIVQLGYTKTGLRRAVDENVMIHHVATILICEAVFANKRDEDPLWSRQAQSFRENFRRLLKFFGLPPMFRPYSLRRGGATDDFRSHGLMERTLLKGRWGTSLAVRQYIQEGLSDLTRLRVQEKTAQLLQTYIDRLAWGPSVSRAGDVEGKRTNFFSASNSNSEMLKWSVLQWHECGHMAWAGPAKMDLYQNGGPSRC